MSGLELLIPLVFEAVGSTAAAVGTAATAIGATVFSGAAAAVAGVGLTGALASIATGAIGSAVIGAGIGGISSLVTGGDFLDGVKNGAIMGGITGGIGGAISGLAAPAVGVAAPDIAADVAANPAAAISTIDTGLPDIAGGTTAIGGTAASAAPSAFTGFNSGVGAGAGTLSGSDVARLGSAANGTAASGTASVGAAGAAPAPGGGFSGFLNRNSDLVGGLLQGVGKSLSGDSIGAVADTNNKGAMDRQTQQQDYYAGNYDIKNGLLPSVADNGAGRPAPGQPAQQQGTGRWEYVFDPTQHALVRRPVSA